MQNKHLFLKLKLVLLTVLIWGCQENVVHQYRSVDSKCWRSKEKVEFCVDTIRKAGVYDCSLEVRLDRQYYYKNLWLVVETQGIRSGFLRSDTVNLAVVDESGEMVGEGRNLLLYQHALAPFMLAKDDSLHIQIHHIMSADSIAGVHDVGIFLSSRKG